MDIVIHDGARVPRGTAVGHIRSQSRKSLFTRFMDALRETRRRQAGREIAKYAHLMTPEPNPTWRQQPKVRR